MPNVKLENVKLACIDSGKPGVGSYLHMYYIGLEYIQKKLYLTDIMLGLVNVAFNVAHKAVCTGHADDTFTCFSALFAEPDARCGSSEKGRLLYISQVQPIPIFESPLTEGEKGANVQQKNWKTAMKGVLGNLFLESYFEVIEKIAEEAKGFTSEYAIWDYHYHGIGCHTEILPSAMVNFAKSLNNNMIKYPSPLHYRVRVAWSVHHPQLNVALSGCRPPHNAMWQTHATQSVYFVKKNEAKCWYSY